MKMLVGVLALCALAGSARCASDAIAWCYHDSSCAPATWATVLSPQFCNGSRQSPINIVAADAQEDANLTSFTFTNYNNTSSLTRVTNTGRTIKVALDGVSVSGGNLAGSYQSIQFHLHWGNGTLSGGSEHTVDGVRYPMEMHIVNMKAIYNGNLTLAAQDPEGLAALGFLIEVMEGDSTASPASWQTLTSFLRNITLSGDNVAITSPLSLDDLLTGVDRARYYRYMGSLTTPTCNEIVVWTVFKDTIKLSRDLINLFSQSVHVGNATSILMTNTFRPIQPNQRVTTQAMVSGSSINLASAKMALAAILAFKGF